MTATGSLLINLQELTIRRTGYNGGGKSEKTMSDK
jgi:hypothetical protein